MTGVGSQSRSRRRARRRSASSSASAAPSRARRSPSIRASAARSSRSATRCAPRGGAFADDAGAARQGSRPDRRGPREADETSLDQILQPVADHLHRHGPPGFGVQGDPVLSRSADQDLDEQQRLIGRRSGFGELNNVPVQGKIRARRPRAIRASTFPAGSRARRPHQLVQIMYEELLKALDAMAFATARGDYVQRGEHQSKALAILTGLETSLDFDKGGRDRRRARRHLPRGAAAGRRRRAARAMRSSSCRPAR